MGAEGKAGTQARPFVSCSEPWPAPEGASSSLGARQPAIVTSLQISRSVLTGLRGVLVWREAVLAAVLGVNDFLVALVLGWAAHWDWLLRSVSQEAVRPGL